jgi:hypothetical protein
VALHVSINSTSNVTYLAFVIAIFPSNLNPNSTKHMQHIANLKLESNKPKSQICLLLKPTIITMVHTWVLYRRCCPESLTCYEWRAYGCGLTTSKLNVHIAPMHQTNWATQTNVWWMKFKWMNDYCSHNEVVGCSSRLYGEVLHELSEVPLAFPKFLSEFPFSQYLIYKWLYSIKSHSCSLKRTWVLWLMPLALSFGKEGIGV